MFSIRALRALRSGPTYSRLGDLHPASDLEKLSAPHRRRFLPRLLAAVVTALLPSFLLSVPTCLRRTSRPNPTPLSPTAYLDGLRGVAALTVYIFHLTYLWFPFLRAGYGSTPDDTRVLQLPLLRVFHSGRASVTTFFVISGYVLTLKSITAVHRGHPEKVLEALAGGLFRRPFRLYLPIIVSTGIVAVLVRWQGVLVPDLRGGDVPPRLPTAGHQFWHWVATTEKMVSPFRAVTGRENLWGNEYNGHLWTIPTEFKGSLEVFLYPETHGAQSWGFEGLERWVPGWYKGNEDRVQQFWISVGSILFIGGLMGSPGGRSGGEPVLQRVFTSGFAQYLGKISYSLYLWHGTVNHVIALRYLHPAWKALQAAEIAAIAAMNKGDTAQAEGLRSAAMAVYTREWLWVAFLNTLFLFWISDLFHRGVDTPSVKLTRRISEWALAKS
ncbi:hypothetical protein OQA88_11 [Cercophora sp. LCS_1]